MERHPLYSRISAFYDLTFEHLLGQGNEWGCAELERRGIKDVLEVGIGTGFSLDFYAAGTRVTGIDLNESMLDEARKRAQKRIAKKADIQVELLVMNAQALTFADASFDAVFLPSVLTVVPEPDLTVREAVRVLKPGGTLIAVCHLVEESYLPPQARAWADPITRKLFGFTMGLSDRVFRSESQLEIQEIVPTNLLLKKYPLSFLVKAIKRT